MFYLLICHHIFPQPPSLPLALSIALGPRGDTTHIVIFTAALLSCLASPVVRNDPHTDVFMQLLCEHL